MKYKSEKENNKEESSIESLLRSVVAGRVISFFSAVFKMYTYTYGQKNETKKKPYEVADNHHAATQSEHNACALSIWLLLLLYVFFSSFFF